MKEKIYIFFAHTEFFGEFVRFLKYELEKRGEIVEITNDASRNDGIWLLTYEDFLCQFDTAGKRYIAIQTENHVKSSIRYELWLQEAEHVWDYSTNLRIGYSEFWELEREEMKDIDILFFGTMNPKREETLRKIENVHIVDKVWGVELQRLIDRSKIVLSVHHYENSNNDMARLASLIANRNFIVAEKWNDARYEELKDKFVIAEPEELNEVCQYFLANPLERIRCVEKSYNWLKNEYKTEFPVRKE